MLIGEAGHFPYRNPKGKIKMENEEIEQFFKELDFQVAKQPSAEGALLGHSAISSHLRLLGYPEKALYSMLKCGTSTGQYIQAQCDCQTKAIPLSHRCNLRTCETCSKTRQIKVRRKYLPFLKKYQLQHSTEFLSFLTISPENYTSLEEGLKHVRSSFTKLLRREYVKTRVKGGFYVIEARNRNSEGFSNGWNIHLHIVLYGQFLDNRLYGKCSECNYNLLKYDRYTEKFLCGAKKCRSLNVVWNGEDSRLVREFKASSGRPCNIRIERFKQHDGLVDYLIKYISSSKGSFSTPLDFAKYIFYTHNKRLINSFGVFYKTKLGIVEYHCDLCFSKISFTLLDPEGSYILEHPRLKPPPPLSLSEF